MRVQLKNYGSQTATGVTASITSDDPYVTITDANETFGDVAAGATIWSGDDFGVQVSMAPAPTAARCTSDSMSSPAQTSGTR